MTKNNKLKGNGIMESMYVKSDGNGGVVIGRGMMAFIVLLIILLSSIVSVVAYSVGVRGDVNNNIRDIADVQEDVDEVQEDIDVYGKDITKIQNQIETIQRDISEIKGDIKELLQQSGG